MTYCLPNLLITPLSNMDTEIESFLNEITLGVETSVLMNRNFYIYSSGFGYAWKSSKKILVRILGSMILNGHIMKYADMVYISVAKKRRFAKFFNLC